jgi:PIN domain nuclease of toxin-antitoxin system
VGRRSARVRIISLAPHLLLDTHVLVRWLLEPKRLSREQARILRDANRRGEPLAFSAITLLEIAVLFGRNRTGLRVPIRELFSALDAGTGFQVVPIDVEVAAEVAELGDMLRDPADRAIVASARVQHLRLVTSDRRIIESKLAPVVE